MSPSTPITDVDVLLAGFWGKADPVVAVRGDAHHTVLGHSLDVAAAAHVLVHRNLRLRTQLAGAAGLDPDVTAMSYAALCAIHDIGKLDTRFQRKVPAVADIIRAASTGITSGPYDHGTEGFRQIEDDAEALYLLQELFGPEALPLLRAVCGHHGSLPSRAEPDSGRANLPRSIRREDARARSALLGTVAQFFRRRGAAIPWPSTPDGALVQRVAGLCAIADWVGSNADYFPYRAGPIPDLDAYWDAACAHAEAACNDAGLLRAATATVGFSDLFPGYAPRDVQLLTEAVRTDEPALVMVEAEMGKGKTEAAVSLAARFLAQGTGDGITVALPTMATSNAMFARVAEVVPRLFPLGEVQLALAHGRASREPRFMALVQHGLRSHDPDAAEASVACARWLLNKKRILLAQVGVGTVDQALQAALVVRHQFVRMFGLSRNVVIVDEVHAYDAYMEVLLEHLLAWLGALHVPVILLSATLPSERRASLARAWQRGAIQESEDTIVGKSLSEASSSPYPLVTVTTRTYGATHSGGVPAESRTLLVERSSWSRDVDDYAAQVSKRLLAAARQGGRVVWIRNTVGEAQSAFRALATIAGTTEHLLFHARFRGCDRAGIERSVLDRFGKSAPEGGRVLIATQVVEQSLDLDFDELHTDLAPIDLIFQRSGRLHRHKRHRLDAFGEPRLVVHGPGDDDVAALRFGPSAYVYDEGTLWIADRTLRARATLELPRDIRPLVEETYHPESRAALLPLGGPDLVRLEEERRTKLEAKRTKARRCCIPSTTADPDGGAALDDDEDAVQAFTRDGMSATLLPLVWGNGGARTLYGAEGELPWTLDAGKPDAWRLATHLLDQTLSIPAQEPATAVAPSQDPGAWGAWVTQFARFTEECHIGSRTVPVPMRWTGSAYEGGLKVGGRRRRLTYTQKEGLQMSKATQDEESR